MQDCLHYRLGSICLDNHAFWIEECSTNLPTNNEYGILWYFNVFMKLFLDDFNVFNDLKMLMAKLWLCFDKCREFDISLNLEQCIFLVYPTVILGYVVSKARKLSNSKKILIVVNMLTSKTPKDIHVFNGMAQFYWCFIKNFSFIMALITKLLRKIEVFVWTTEC
jgi:hypothetical protein